MNCPVCGKFSKLLLDLGVESMSFCKPCNSLIHFKKKGQPPTYVAYTLKKKKEVR